MTSVRDLAAAADVEFAARGMPLKPGAALQMLRQRVTDVASQAGVTPRTAQGYLTLEGVREMARNTARTMKEQAAAEAELPAVPVTMHDVGLVVSTLVRVMQESVNKLTLGWWAVQPGSVQPQRDAAVAAQLSQDVTEVRSLLGAERL